MLALVHVDSQLPLRRPGVTVTHLTFGGFDRRPLLNVGQRRGSDEHAQIWKKGLPSALTPGWDGLRLMPNVSLDSVLLQVRPFPGFSKSLKRFHHKSGKRSR